METETLRLKEKKKEDLGNNASREVLETDGRFSFVAVLATWTRRLKCTHLTLIGQLFI